VSLIPPLLLQQAAAAYTIQNSGSFDGVNDFLFRTFGTPSNSAVFSLSVWLKLASAGVNHILLEAFTGFSDAGRGFLFRQSDGKWVMSGQDTVWRLTSGTFNNTSSFDHYLFVHDGANSTASLRDRMYFNGVEVTSFTIANNNSLNTPLGPINQATGHTIGINDTNQTSNPLHGLLADVIFTDGIALVPSDVGEFADTVWVPKAYTGSFGAQGCFLEFQNASNLGEDSSGNGNNWTNNGVTQSSVTPTS
jgi:hypothetical protein